MISKPLKFALSILPDSKFIRCQQSYIVNLNMIASYNKSGYLILLNGQEVPVSGPNRKLVLNRIFS
ncbi:hypothetical protein BST91_03245 [Nonlabens tegetincola]|uniref:LytTR family DNA-binding domain-containing protein n=1 Tax=Nonlabens tegetincola TaxID=323273 RepID=UPI000A209F54|nr:hypothetical protein BST91_03245 [Nonlabens tegetincola]